MYKLDEVIGAEDAELVRKVIERKFNGVQHWTTRQFIATLLGGWPLNGQVVNLRSWQRTDSDNPDEQYVSLLVSYNQPVNVWSVGKGWL